MAAAEYTFGPFFQGTTVTMQITLVEADFPQSGSVWRIKAESARDSSSTISQNATLHTLVSGDTGYDAGIAKYSATWTFTPTATRDWVEGQYDYQIEHVRGGAENVQIYGTFKVRKGVNADG